MNIFSMLDLLAGCSTVRRDWQRRWNGLETLCAPHEGPRLFRRCHMIVVDVNGRYTVRFVQMTNFVDGTDLGVQSLVPCGRIDCIQLMIALRVLRCTL